MKKNWTAGGQAKVKGGSIGTRSITSDSTVNKQVTRKATKNGNGPRKKA